MRNNFFRFIRSCVGVKVYTAIFCFIVLPKEIVKVIKHNMRCIDTHRVVFIFTVIKEKFYGQIGIDYDKGKVNPNAKIGVRFKLF